MRHPLESRIAALRGQVRRLIAAHGMAWLVLGVLAAIITAGFLDWLVHLVPEVRLVLLGCVLAASVWLAIRYVFKPLIVQFNDLDIALKIEERWPGLNDRLASTIQFLSNPSDDALGSKAMRDHTVAQTIEETKTIDFREVIDARPIRNALGWSASVVGAAVLLLVMVPISSRLALQRLFVPYGAAEWPKLTHLTILDSETRHKAAKGEPFTLAVGVAKGEHVPSSARVKYIFADGETSEEPLRPADDGVFRGRLETVTRDFKFTVSAGDDKTAAWDVKVVPPPVLTDLVVKAIPPEYTGQAPQTLAPGNTQLKAVFGTRVELVGKANKPLASVTLRVGEGLSTEAAKLTANAQGVTATLAAEVSVPFWFELKDTDGFKNQEAVRYELRTVPDETPRVSFEDPTNDRDVPSKAVVPLQIAVDDDYGIHSVRMVYKIARGGSEPSKEVILPLFDGTAKREGGPSKHEVVNYRWNLAPLKLEPGTIISFHADARDFDNLKGPNLGKSRELRLRIVSDEEAGRQIEEQQRALKDDIERTHAMQKQAQTPVDDAIRTLSRTAKLPTPIRDNLRNAETIQRQVTSRITSKSDGLEQKIKRITDDLKNFNVPNPDVERQMQAMQQAVDRLKEKNLTPAEQSLTQGGKTLDQQSDPKGQQPQQNGEQSQPKGGQQQQGPQTKGAQSQPETGALAQAKNQDSSKPQSGDAQPKGDPSKPTPGDAQPKGDLSKPAPGDGQPKDDSSKPAPGDAQPKGEPSKPGQGDSQPKGDSSKPAPGDAQPKGDPSKPGQGQPQQGGDQQPQGQPEQAKSDQKSSPQVALNDASKNQKAIADELKKMLDSMSEFDTYRGVVKEAKSLLQQQEQAMKQAAEAASKPDLAGKAPEALTPEQKAELENQGAKQAELAKLLQNFEAKLDEMAKKVEKDDPLAAAALKDAAKQSRQKATAAKMAESGEQLSKNQMGQARQNQDQARNDLKEMVDSIQNRRERELARLVQELKQAEQDLKDLKNRQMANLKKTAEAKKMTDPKAREKELQKLAKEQTAIQQEMKKQLQKLAKLGADKAAQQGENAAGKMAKAEQDLNQDQGEQAEEDMEEALQNLRQAQQELAENRRDAEEQLAMEQISKMADSLKSIAERQDKMIKETSAYEEARAKAAGKLSIAQRTGVRDLGRVQTSLKDETGELIERLGEGAPVFTLTLKRATSAMDDAAGRLQALKTDGQTVTLEKSAAGRFKQLLDSLKPDKMKKGDGDAGEGGEGGGGGGGGGGDGIPAAAQIKVLKMLQQEINDRTDEFDKLVQRGEKLSPEQETERTKLHDDQGALADLVRDLTRPKQADGEDD
jgi:hypothetical protein